MWLSGRKTQKDETKSFAHVFCPKLKGLRKIAATPFHPTAKRPSALLLLTGAFRSFLAAAGAHPVLYLLAASLARSTSAGLTHNTPPLTPVMGIPFSYI
jgi:hypothetical protein